MPRFVILEHDWPERHWDLMLEAGTALRTWRLSAPLAPGADVGAQAIGDHRLLYLDFEGPVSGNRGCVKRWDWGEFDWRTEGDPLVVVLAGRICKGTLEIRQGLQMACLSGE